MVIYDGIPVPSQHDVPLLRDFLTDHHQLDTSSLAPREVGVTLARLIKRIRPELDIYLLTDRQVEKLAGDPAASMIRRVFYEVEELTEVHLNILEGVADRFSTPHFDNLKQYAARPIATFHALPIARGKSIMKSNWIRDMGEFYGQNLFLAESSATTGGLDSMLEPTGNIKVAQEKFARAVGADHVFFVTNGTSTSNKMVYQAVTKPGDIVIADRNCHKSHHYGMVLSGAQPLYVEAFPMTEYSMYGAVPLRTIKQALLESQGRGTARSREDGDAHQLHVRRARLQHAPRDGRVPGDQAGPDLPVGRGVVRFRALVAVPAPAHRPGRRRCARGVARDVPRRWRRSRRRPPSSARISTRRIRALLERRLVPDPRKMRIRVYETDSVHKSMSCLRQGSIVAVRDEDYNHHVSAFREAVFIHASTSPNAQIIASLDVARRQMELEGYELVMRSIEIALAIRRAVAEHPIISKYFRVLGADAMIPAEFRASGFQDFLAAGSNWMTALKAVQEDEFFLDPTRMTLVCGTAGLRRHLVQGPAGFEVQHPAQQDLAQQRAAPEQHQQHAQRRRAADQGAARDLAADRGANSPKAARPARAAFAARVKSLMEDVPDLPNFSRFHDGYREDPDSITLEGDMRTAFFAAYEEDDCEYLPLMSPKIDERLKSGPEMVSANFVIPYPPGFPIMVPGQVIEADTIGFMRKLDVKEIHGYNATRGLKLIKLSAIGKPQAGTRSRTRRSSSARPKSKTTRQEACDRP